MKDLQILVLEDIRADFLLVERHLVRQGLAARCEHADTLERLQDALGRGLPDIILSDYNLPGPGFDACLAAIRSAAPEVPVILVSGSVGEERAVELLKCGVADFVLKDNLTRLVPAIERACREVAERRARLSAEQAVRDGELRLRLTLEDHARQLKSQVAARTSELVAAQSELGERYRQLQAQAVEIEDLYQNAPCGYHAVDAEGCLTRVNDTELRWLGYRREEMLGRPLADFVTPESRRRFAQNFVRLKALGEVLDVEVEFLRKDGTVLSVLANATAVYDDTGRFARSRSTLVDITDRKRLDKERGQLAARSAELTRHLVLVQEEERRRLTCMIDDLLSPNLSAVKMELAGLHDERLADARALLEDSLSSLRDLGADLRPAVLDYAGLFAAVESYAAQFSSRTGLPVRVSGCEPKDRLPRVVESCLFRIVQEALSNSLQHSGARQVFIELRRDGPLMLLELADDGVGFSPDKPAGGESGPLLGLATMRARAEFAGGRLDLDSSPGAGTRIRVEVALAD